jgi:hypothetical protein
MPPTQSANAAGQLIMPEKAKISAAEAFMAMASMFLVAAAARICWPAMVSVASIRKPMPPPK